MNLQAAIKDLVAAGFGGTQQDLRQQLASQGLDVNQSSVSRALKRMGARKEEGKWVLDEPKLYDSLNEHVVSVQHNGQLIVIRTIPGSAHFVASFLDQKEKAEIMGTIAGDDTVVVIPSDPRQTEKTVRTLNQLIDHHL